jgi:hypothetical protein
MFQAKLIKFSIFCVCTLGALGVNIKVENSIQCGLYGFRCIDDKHAEICDKNHGETSEKRRIFKCADGLKCDEDKYEFCSPLSNCSCSESRNAVKSTKKTHLNIKRQVFNLSLSDFDDEDEENSVTTQEKDPWNGNPPVTCNMHGFYPGLMFQNFSFILF